MGVTLADCRIFQQIDITHFYCAGENATRIALCACGEEYSAAVSRGEGDVFTWGLGIAGQLSNGELSNRDHPTAMTAMATGSQRTGGSGMQPRPGASGHQYW
mmetsp:Transcript_18006/g.24715  ORF Transcript_18006/g.24715 Transcript_18006/m.24715 type:complete len:102 (-) Transcript_18006:1011-1316(-)